MEIRLHSQYLYQLQEHFVHLVKLAAFLSGNLIVRHLRAFNCSENVKFVPKEKISKAKILPETDIRKRPYLSQMADNQKYEGALLSRTLKVRENKVPSEYRFFADWPRYGRF